MVLGRKQRSPAAQGLLGKKVWRCPSERPTVLGLAGSQNPDTSAYETDPQEKRRPRTSVVAAGQGWGASGDKWKWKIRERKKNEGLYVIHPPPPRTNVSIGHPGPLPQPVYSFLRTERNASDSDKYSGTLSISGDLISPLLIKQLWKNEKLPCESSITAELK